MSVWTSPIVIGFGVACVAVLALTLATMRQHQDTATVSLGALLLLLWAFSKVSMVAFGFWPTAAAGPVINMAAVLVCMVSWWREHKAWKLILALLMEFKAVIHAVYWTIPDPVYRQAYTYILTLNVIFALQLACVSMPGAGVVASMVSNRLSSYRRRRHNRLHPVALP